MCADRALTPDPSTAQIGQIHNTNSAGQGHPSQAFESKKTGSHTEIPKNRDRSSSSKERVTIRRPKPWDHHSKNTTGSTLRHKLPGIEAYDRDLDYHAHATPKIILRLERVVGSDRIRLNDPRYMSNLSQKIDEEERKVWRQRVQKRQNTEHGRYRQLVIDGVLEPSHDMADIRSHPIFRVNRMMKRINSLVYTPGDHRIPPPIKPLEPFEEQMRTGYLFGWHKNHYLKVNRPTYSQGSYLEEADEMEASRTESETAQFLEEEESGAGEDEGGEYEGEEYGGQADEAKSQTLSFKRSQTADLANYLRRESLSQARKYLDLDEAKLQKDFEIGPKPFVQAVFDDTTEQSDAMFDYSANLLNTYQREQLKTDEFCTKVHRRLFV